MQVLEAFFLCELARDSSFGKSDDIFEIAQISVDATLPAGLINIFPIPAQGYKP